MFISFIIYLFTIIGIYGIFSLSLNLQLGFGGLPNFGLVLFPCVGAYASVLLESAGVPFLIAFLGSMIVAGLFGFLLSLPTKNLKATYWAISTIAAQEIVRIIIRNEEWLTGGTKGISNILRPLSSYFPNILTYSFFYLFMVWIILVIIYFTLERINMFPFGRAIKVIRETEILPLAFGRDISQFRVKTMVIGGIIGGVGGNLFAHYLTYIDPLMFVPSETFLVWGMVIIGGLGNNKGILVGTLVVEMLYNSTRFLKDYLPVSGESLASLRMIVIGALIVLTLIYKKEGLIPEKKNIYKI